MSKYILDELSKYILDEPKSILLGIDTIKYYVPALNTHGCKYLRPSGEVLEHTGYGDGFNIGFWNTYDEALKAKQSYERGGMPLWLKQKDIK